jgi:hypothetical protein
MVATFAMSYFRSSVCQTRYENTTKTQFYRIFAPRGEKQKHENPHVLMDSQHRKSMTKSSHRRIFVLCQAPREANI